MIKKILLSLVLLSIVLTSCDEYYHNGVIRQYVESTQATANPFDSGYYLKTVVHYDSKLISVVKDDVNINKPDAIEILKRKRYKEAINLIDKIRAIDDIKVSKK